MASLIQTYMPQTSTRGSGPVVARASGDTAVAAITNVFLPKKNAPTPDEKPETVVASADDAEADEVTAEDTAEDAEVETVPAKASGKAKKVIAAAALLRHRLPKRQFRPSFRSSRPMPRSKKPRSTV